MYMFTCLWLFYTQKGYPAGPLWLTTQLQQLPTAGDVGTVTPGAAIKPGYGDAVGGYGRGGAKNGGCPAIGKRGLAQTLGYTLGYPLEHPLEYP